MKSLKRFFISFPYIKHTNNNVSILIFVFNKYKFLILRKIKRLKGLVIRLKRKKYNNKKKKFIKKDSKKYNVIINKNNSNKILNLILTSKNKDIRKKITKYIYFKKKKNVLKKTHLSNLYINMLKFNNINMINIKNIISKIYNKSIYINIINMKYLYLDNSNLIQAITRKLNDRKKKVLKVLKKTLKSIKLAKFLNVMNELNNKNKSFFMQFNIKSINNVVSNLKNKHLIGIFLEAKGRLTRRMTASRAVYKLRYKGNMKNFNNSNKLYRGYIKSNVIINKNNSNNKNGSFGITSKANTL